MATKSSVIERNGGKLSPNRCWLPSKGAACCAPTRGRTFITSDGCVLVRQRPRRDRRMIRRRVLADNYRATRGPGSASKHLRLPPGGRHNRDWPAAGCTAKQGHLKKWGAAVRR